MIDKRTVVILGAGASTDYGYPLGTGLKKLILEKSFVPFDWAHTTVGLQGVVENMPLKSSIEVHSFLHYNCNFEFEHIAQFDRDFRASPKSSIDAFLEQRPEFLELGKMFIAMSILGCEDYSFISNNQAINNWYGYLFNLMTTSWDEFKKNRITIITYNYDRSFETYFVAALMATFGRNLFDCQNAFNEAIKVIHVHGVIASGLPFDQMGNTYNSDVSGGQIRQGARGLRIIHEEEEIDANYQKVREELQKAEQIFILGFGYHKMNLERLRLQNYEAPIYSTRTGISDLNVMRINQAANKSILFSPTTGYGIVDFFDNEVSLDGHISSKMPTPLSKGYVGR